MSSDGNVIVKAEGVDKYFGRNHVLRSVSLEVRKQEVVCIIGPSGSGKTTLLRCINHLERDAAQDVVATEVLVDVLRSHHEIAVAAHRAPRAGTACVPSSR